MLSSQNIIKCMAYFHKESWHKNGYNCECCNSSRWERNLTIWCNDVKKMTNFPGISLGLWNSFCCIWSHSWRLQVSSSSLVRVFCGLSSQMTERTYKQWIVHFDPALLYASFFGAPKSIFCFLLYSIWVWRRESNPQHSSVYLAL
jgi:hypothetical protein